MPIVKTGKPSFVSTKCVVVAMGHKAVLASHLASSKIVVEAKDGRMHGEIARRSDGAVDLAAEIKKHPEALWLRVKAIEADRENDNGDYFSEAEIIKAYKTFEGCPVFTNHENGKVENAKGKVVLAEWDDEDKSVYCTMFIDREANPALCRAVEEGYVTDVSMGTQVDYSICSVCKQKAHTADQYCFLAGTPVLMADLSVKSIENIAKGEEVIDAFGNRTKVIGTFKRDVSEKIKAIVSRSIYGELLCTGNHKLFVEGEKGTNLVHADCITEDNFLLIPVYRPKESQILFEGQDLDENGKKMFCRLLGYYAAEGSRIYDKLEELHGIEFSLGLDETELKIGQDIVQIIQAIFNKDVEIIDRRKYGSNGCDIRFYDREKCKIITENVRGGARDKTLSSAIISLPEEYIREFISAYIDGDGHADKYGRIITTSASNSLASQIYHLLLRLNVSPCIGEYENVGGPTNRDKKCIIFRTEIANSHVHSLNSKSTKCAKAMGIVKTNRIKRIFTEDNNYSRHKVFSVEEREYQGPVYNIETESGSYVASNTAAKNCDHVKTMKGRAVDGKKVYEENYGLKFIEISVVTDGACKDCTIREVIDPADFVQQAQETLRAAANNIKTIKEGGLYKDGGQAEIEMLNAAMDNIEEVLRSMLDQRQYIDLEFMNDLTEVFAELQHVTDELVDQGYGSLGQPQAQPQQEMGVPPMPEPAEGAAPEPFTTGPSPTGVGSVTRPAGNVTETKIGSPASRIQNKVKDLQERIAKIQKGINETTAAAGGEDVSREENLQKTIEKLANVWQNPSVKQFTTEVAEGDYKIVVGKEEVLGLRGGKKVASLKVSELDPDIRQALKDDPQKTAAHMLDAFKERQAAFQKKAEAAPVDSQDQLGQTMEAQLRDQKPPLHPREDELRHVVTEVQLQSEYRGYDWHKQGLEDPRQCITEKQIHGLGERKDFPGYDQHKAQEKTRDEITELQLRNEQWKGNVTPATSEKEWAAGVSDQKQQITEGQLTDWKDSDERHLPDHRITEKQLREQGDPLGRRIASVTKENAKEVIADARKAIGFAAVSAGASPEDVVAANNEFQANPRNGMAAIQTIEAFASKKLTVGKESGFKDQLLSKLSEEFTPDVALAALKVVASEEKAIENLSKAIEEASRKPEKQLSPEEILREAVATKEDEKKEEKQAEEVKVLMTVADVKVDANDKAAFAKAAFEQASKLASAQGVSVTKNVHVKRTGDDVEVALEGVKQASKQEKKAAKCQCGTECECTCEGDDKKCKCEAVKEASAEKQTKLAKRSDDRKKVVEGQFGGGGGGMPAPGFEAGGPGAAGGTTMPTPAPAGGPMPTEPDVGALAEEPTADAMDETPESMPPGSICPSCGSDDVDVKGGDFGCNNCGAEGAIEVNLKMRNWPDTIQEKGPTGGGSEETEPGIGEMEGGPGVEMPEIGVAAVFKVTPEMVKTSGQKPIGSFCPHCGSPKVRLAENKHSGQCQECNGMYRIDTYWEPTDNCLIGRIAWHDNNVRRLVSSKKNKVKVARTNAVKNASTMNQKKETLEVALKAKGWTAKFAMADLKQKAIMIGELAEQGLIRKD